MVTLVRQNYRKNVQLFKEEKKRLRDVLDDDAVIEHVGSTSIPRMSGKNIIDILVGISAKSRVEKNAKAIEENGYFRGGSDANGEYVFFASKKEETGNGDVHIHLTVKDSLRFSDFLVLKTYLLENPKIAKEYSSLKYKILKKSDKNRRLYKKLKSEYVDKLLACARNQYGKTS